MNDLDDLLDPKDPEVKAAMAEAEKHSKYHRDHPEQCPHYGIVAPVIDGQGDQPGFCLDCNADDVMERETDCPMCEAEGFETA